MPEDPVGESEPGSPGGVDEVVADLQAKVNYCRNLAPSVHDKCPQQGECVKRHYRFVKKFCWRLDGY